MQEYSTRDYSWIAPAACLRYIVSIGDKSTVGLASVVTKHIQDDVTVMGSPAREVSEQKKLLTHCAETINEAKDSEKNAK